MEDEIKEILEYIKAYYLDCNIDKILDYITKLEQCYCNRTDCIGRIKDSKKYDSLLQKYEKLQEENKELNRMCELFSKSLYNAELTDYKSRIDKAIEYLEQPYRDNFDYSKTELLNILNGGDSNE